MNSDSGIQKVNRLAIVGGNGAVGKLFAELLGSHCHSLVICDPRIPHHHIEGHVEFIKGDINDFLESKYLSTSDIVLLTTPEEPAVKAIDLFCAKMRENQALIDTMSVKTDIVSAMKLGDTECEKISINPMFGPSLGFRNQSVAVVKINSGPLSEFLLERVVDAGCQLIEMDEYDHDKSTAIIQCLTHAVLIAFGMTLNQVGYKAEDLKHIWTPPHSVMLSLLSRMLVLDPEVYWDIQLSNPFASEVREKLHENTVKMGEIIDLKDYANFRTVLQQFAEIMGSESAELATLAQRIFSILNR
jgi:prephenate dehydrogenase